MKRYILMSLIAVCLCFAACQNSEDIQNSEKSVVSFNLDVDSRFNGGTRAVDDYTGTDIDKAFSSLHYVLFDGNGTVVKQDSINREKPEVIFELGQGAYKLYVYGEGTNTAFNHVNQEVFYNLTSESDVCYKPAMFYCLRHEMYIASKAFTVDGSGNAQGLDLTLTRANGMLDIDLTAAEAEGLTINGGTMYIPNAYVANYMTLGGEYNFNIADTHTSGYYGVIQINGPLLKVVDGHFRVFMMPSLDNYSGGLTSTVSISYTKAGKQYTKEYQLPNFKIQRNRITQIKVDLE